jgi:glycine/D-amino acid oxidase-like deaminating enzyme
MKLDSYWLDTAPTFTQGEQEPVSGLVDMTADRLPRAGQHRGMFFSLGYSGHGVQMSVHMGQQMAQVMAGNTNANPWHGLDWPAIPGHFGQPWFLPFVGAYYRFQDLIH